MMLAEERAVRADERRRIAKHMRTVAGENLRNPESDAIDGYAMAVVLELAETIEKFQPPSEAEA